MFQSNAGQSLPLQKGTAIIVRYFSFWTCYDMKQVTEIFLEVLHSRGFSWFNFGLDNDLKAVTNLRFISMHPRYWAGVIL